MHHLSASRAAPHVRCARSTRALQTPPLILMDIKQCKNVTITQSWRYHISREPFGRRRWAITTCSRRHLGSISSRGRDAEVVYIRKKSENSLKRKNTHPTLRAVRPKSEEKKGGGSEESAWNNWRWSVPGEITVLTSWCLFIVSPACASLVNTNTHLVLELPVRIAGCTANWANGSYSWRQLAITLVICCSLFLFWLFLYVAPFNWDMVFDLQIYAAPLSGQNWTEF